MSTGGDSQQTDNLDEVEKDTLISLLKDKSKELKTCSTKLSKLEEKYVKIFKENKNYAKDKDAVEKFIRAVFETEADKFLPYDPGFLDGTKLAEVYQTKNNEVSSNFKKTIKELEVAKEELDKRNQELLTKLGDAEEKFTAKSNEMRNLQQRFDEQDSNSAKLLQEINDLNSIIKDKDVEIAKYKKVEDEIASLKAESLIQELKSKNNGQRDIKDRLEQSQKTDQILKLKNEVEESHERIVQLERRLADLQGELAQKNDKYVDKQQLRNKEVQVDFFSEPGSFNGDLHNEPELNGNGAAGANRMRRYSYPEKLSEQSPSNSQTARLSTDIVQTDSNGRFTDDQQTLNQQYLKNVVLKYFVYTVGGNEREANILMHAICTILKMSKEERNMIENARSNSIWTRTKNLLF